MGQQVIVSDPRMSSYLPLPSQQTSNSSDLSEVLLRFSNEGQPFLHSLAATATFGRKFAIDTGAGWKIGGEPVQVITLMQDEQACLPLQTIEHDRPFILLVERGGCTFLTKLAHATQAGAMGVIVYGNPPDPTGTRLEEGLLRPSADEDSDVPLSDVSTSGMVYIEHFIGEIVSRMLAKPDLWIMVEVLRIGEAELTSHKEQSGVRNEVGETPGREGKLALGEWEICNLRIVEGSP